MLSRKVKKCGAQAEMKTNDSKIVESVKRRSEATAAETNGRTDQVEQEKTVYDLLFKFFENCKRVKGI